MLADRRNTGANWVRAAAVFSAAIAGAIGATVVLGWYIGSHTLIGGAGEYIAVQYNTAVGFLCCAAALLAVERGWKRVTTAAAAFFALVTLATAIEYLTSRNLHVDTLFFSGIVGDNVSGRMAPNTTVGFLCVTVALLLLAFRTEFRQAIDAAASLAAFVAAVGAVSATGYLAHLPTAYQWRGQKPIALVTAVAFLSLGTGVIAQAWRCSQDRRLRSPIWFPAPVFVFLMSICGMIAKSMWDTSRIAILAQPRRSLVFSMVLMLVFGTVVSIALVTVIRLAQKSQLRARELQTVNRALDAEIAQKQQQQLRAEELNRALRMVSECNQEIAHSTDEGDLLQRMCELAVGPGGYRLAWVGFALNDDRKTVRIVAKAGEGSAYLNDAFVTWADDELGRGPTGTAIRTARACGCEDVRTDASFLPWRERAAQFGFRSTLVIPLLHDGKAFGAFSLYASNPNAFHDEEKALFLQLVEDLTFGLDSIRIRAARDSAEAALARSEERYRSLTIATAQVIWMTDPNGLVTGDMPTWREFTGATFDELQGWGWLESLHPEDRDRTAKVWSEVVANRALYETEYRLRRHDGEYRHVWVRGVPVLNNDGSIREWVGACTDITERKLAQQELERFSQELQRSNTELQEFAFVASHDLQEPLRKITAFSERLRDRAAGQLDELSLDYLARMHSAAVRMGSLINSLLEYSRVTTRALPFQEVDLAAMVLGILADLEQRIGESHASVKVHALPNVQGDPTQLRQLFQNLLANALKFHAPQKRPEIHVRSESCGQRWNISVSDNGIGFDPAFSDKIFKPFQRLHGRSEYEGSGMGLAICRKIAQRHGAAIQVSSAPGQGATFTVSLPAIQKTNRGIGTPAVTATFDRNATRETPVLEERIETCPKDPSESCSPKTMTTTTC